MISNPKPEDSRPSILRSSGENEIQGLERGGLPPHNAPPVKRLRMRKWRNWQTRKIQVLVPVQGVEVQVLSSAPTFLPWFPF